MELEVVSDFDQALSRTAGESKVFVIGGSQLYQLAIPFAERIYLNRGSGARGGRRADA